MSVESFDNENHWGRKIMSMNHISTVQLVYFLFGSKQS